MNTMLSLQSGWMRKEIQNEACNSEWIAPAVQRSNAEIYQDEHEERCFVRSGN
ncbi:hypothetical protein [Marinobacterium jannaschii]|uniref:hypothetical protein n=1 Tax=Marinobacterium jannaschii TaxID=64970 RepID=UPI000AEE2CD7|nr:hypothetical protein [Marinobacterium jannaschii]